MIDNIYKIFINASTTKAGADCEYAEYRGIFGGCKGALVQLCKGKADCKLIPVQKIIN